MSFRLLKSVAGLLLFSAPIFAQDQTVTAPQPTESSKKDQANTPAQYPEFLRLRRDDKKQMIALETAIAPFVASEKARYPGVQVDLIGAVHIASKGYFQKLNERFKDYDVVLYELVAEEGTRVTPEQATAGRSPVSALQVGMKDMLELDFQLEIVDYQAKNFVHADMSPEEFAKDMADRGDSLLQTMFRMMGAGLAMQASGSSADASLLMAMMAPDRTRQLRRTMAKQFQEMEATTAGMAGTDGKSTLITERNRKALEVMDREIAAGKKKIAIFYGAGHLPDFARRLTNDYGMRSDKEHTEYLEAWDLR